MKLGFLGTGTITSAMVTGLCTGAGDDEIWLSPRNADIAAELAGRFANARVAIGNQALVDTCETVVIAVRPQVAEAVLRELRFRAEQSVISVVSGFSVERLGLLVGPATRIVRAVPLPSTAKRRCPTAIYPRDAVAAELFGRLGAAFAAETERQFDAFCVATATMATWFAFAGELAAWMEHQQIPAQDARDYVARIFAGLAQTAVERPEKSLGELAAEHATLGGTNEQMLGHLRTGGVFTRYADGLDGIMRRVTGG